MLNKSSTAVAGVFGAVLVFVLAAAFFFAIIGVFGLAIAIGALVLCVSLSVWASLRSSDSGVSK